MKPRYRILVSVFAFSQMFPLQAGFAQMDPDLVPPEVLVPVPGAQSMGAPSGLAVSPGMQSPGMSPQGAGRYQGQPPPGMQQGGVPPQGTAGQFSQFQNPYAAAAQQQSGGIQAFVPAGWPFDGLPPPGSYPGGSLSAFPAPGGAVPPAAGYPQGYAPPGLGNTAAQPPNYGGGATNGTVANDPHAPSSGNGQVLPNDPAVSANNADPNTAGPFSSDKECLMCKKKKGEGGENDDSSSGAAGGSSVSAGSPGAGLGSAVNSAMQPPQAQAMQQALPGQTQQGPGRAPGATQQDPIAVIQTTKGPITIRLFKQYAPTTVANFVDLVHRNFYNGIRWHRVVPGFVIQAGCPKGDGTGGFVDPQTGKPRNIPLELHQRLRHNAPGVVAMARFGNDPNSASSQFYITLAPKQQLDNKYSVFGGVLSGMETVQNITANDRILSITLQ